MRLNPFILLVIIITLLLSGCSPEKAPAFRKQYIPYDDGGNIYDEFEESYLEHDRIQKSNSIWQKSQTGRSFYGVPRSYKIGDIIKIKIAIRGKASLSTNLERKSESTASNPIFKFFDSLVPFAARKFGTPAEIQIPQSDGFSTSSSAKGEGETSRKEEVISEISVIVHGVLESGNMFVKGTQEVIINSEKRTVSISGVIRPSDVDNDNSIDSSKVAEARVEYVGQGGISKAHPGRSP